MDIWLPVTKRLGCGISHALHAHEKWQVLGIKWRVSGMCGAQHNPYHKLLRDLDELQLDLQHHTSLTSTMELFQARGCLTGLPTPKQSGEVFDT